MRLLPVPGDTPVTSTRVLLLGGTTEARLLADALHARADVEVLTSLAGRIADPLRPSGPVRVGGFGGVAGLVAWLRAHPVDVVVDATHPFAQTMTAHAVMAAATLDLALVRLERRPWRPQPGQRWHEVGCVAEAAATADALGERLLVTTGRQETSAFADVRAWCLLRSIEAPTPPLPRRCHLLLTRGPFTLESERALLREWDIDVLVTKNSGGQATAAKLLAAHERDIPVVVVQRPPTPGGVTPVHTVEHAMARLLEVRR